MPSHSIKQAKTMSAIAHGWKPKGTVAKIPVKVAKEFHAADAGHKYGKGMPYDKVKRHVKRFRKAAGGPVPSQNDNSIPEDFDKNVIDPDAPNPGEFSKNYQRATRDRNEMRMPAARPGYTTMRRGGRKRYDAGGATDDGSDLPDVGPPAISPGPQISAGLDPQSVRDSLANAAPKKMNAPGVMRALGKYGADRAIDTATLGPVRRFVTSGIDAAKFPAGSEENHEALEDAAKSTADVGVSMLAPGRMPGKMAQSNSFLGPYGAMMLRDAEKEKGAYPLIHPVLSLPETSRDYVGNARDTMTPDSRQALSDELDRRDAAAQKALADPNVNDRDVFKQSAWSRDAAGNPVKEIPDTGAKLTHVGNGSYRLDHPAGDFHSIYDMPYFKFDNGKRGMGLGEASTTVNTQNGKVLGVTLGGTSKEADNPKVISGALHEMAHVINSKEGGPSGANPDNLPFGKVPGLQDQETFPGETPSWWSDTQKAQAAEARAKGVPEERIQRVIGNFQNYKKESGEAQARNTQYRFEHPEAYLEHPEDTEDVGRGLQWQNNMFKPRPQGDIDKILQRDPGMHSYMANLQFAKGGRAVKRARFDLGGGFNPERAAAIGLSRQNSNVQKEGLINSSVPGRTDKLNMNVPSGSYIIPADITSALGEGNTFAGSSILNKMFTKGPFGMNIAKSKGGVHTHAREAKLMKMPGTGTSQFTSNKSFAFAKGGVTPGKTAPIVAAGGEYVIHPDTVAQLGHGDINLGHDILDAFVKQVRAKHIKTLKGLKPPKGSK